MVAKAKRVVAKDDQRPPTLNAEKKSASLKKRRRRSPLTADQFRPKRPFKELCVAGSGDFGQLGLGIEETAVTRWRQVSIEGCKEFTIAAAGGVHSVLLSSDGYVYTTGCNDDGALGRKCVDEEDADFSFRRVEFRDSDLEVHGPVVMVTTGDSHCAALTDKGSVFIWGTFRGKNGAIGIAYNEQGDAIIMKAMRPHLLVDYRSQVIVKIASGTDHIAMLDADGMISTCGAGNAGQLGRIPIDRQNEDGLRFVKRLLMPYRISPRIKNSHWIRYKDVYCTNYGGFAIDEDGVVWTWGLNNYGQAGVDVKSHEPYSEPLPIMATRLTDLELVKFVGDQHVLAISAEGTLYAFGRGVDGRLGIGKCREAEYVPVEVPKMTKSPVIGCSASGRCSFAWTADGLGYAWGTNVDGMMGLKVNEDEVIETPMQIQLKSQPTIGQISTNGVFSLLLLDK